MRHLWGYEGVIIQKALCGVLGNLGGFCIMGLIHFDGLLRSFSIRLCWVRKSSEYFLWTHEMQEYICRESGEE